jgi:Gly-Xaa carboxypeptidase
MVLNRRYQQPPVMRPKRRQDINHKNIDNLFQSTAFRDVVARRLAGAVQIPTIAYDNMGLVGTDPRWEIFFRFSGFLKETFPRVYGEPLNIPAM